MKNDWTDAVDPDDLLVFKSALQILIWLGRSDGYLADVELAVVENYAIEAARSLGAELVKLSALEKWCRQQFPTDDDLLPNCNNLIELGESDDRVRLLDHAIKLIAADGVITNEEQMAASEFAELIKPTL